MRNKLGIEIKSGLRAGKALRADSPRCKSMGEDLDRINTQIATYSSEQDRLLEHYSETKVATTLTQLKLYRDVLTTYIAKECDSS